MHRHTRTQSAVTSSVWRGRLHFLIRLLFCWRHALELLARSLAWGCFWGGVARSPRHTPVPAARQRQRWLCAVCGTAETAASKQQASSGLGFGAVDVHLPHPVELVRAPSGGAGHPDDPAHAHVVVRRVPRRVAWPVAVQCSAVRCSAVQCRPLFSLRSCHPAP